MIQSKISLEESQVQLLQHCKTYGFKDKSEMVRKALDHFRRELELQELEKSAELYAQIYEHDAELQSLTDDAMAEWPE